MTIATGSRVSIGYIAEETRGTTPGTPQLKALRTTSRNINVEKGTIQSEEVRSDRQIADVRHGMVRVTGDFGFELGLRSYDDILEACLSGTWAQVTVSGTPDLAAVAASHKVVRAAGSWLTDGFRVGDYVTTAGFSNSANNRTAIRVSAVTSTDLVLDVGSVALVDEASAAGPTVTYVGRRLGIGTTLRTFTIERAFNDASLFEVFRGVAINTLAISLQPEQMVRATAGLIGLQHNTVASSTISAAAYTAAPGTSPFSAFDGSMYEGNTKIGVVTGLELSLDNTRTLAGVVGSPYSPDIFEGEANVTGTVSVFFDSATLFNKFLNETETSIAVRCNDVNGADFISLVLPRVKYTGGSKNPPRTGPVIQQMPFRALWSSTENTTINLQRSNAS